MAENPASVAEALASLDQLSRFSEACSGARAILSAVTNIDMLTAAANERQAIALQTVAEAEQNMNEKLAIFEKKIARASQESDRILQKAGVDADVIVLNAQEQATALLDPAKVEANILQTGIASSRAVLNTLSAAVSKKQKEFDALEKSISAARAKIEEFRTMDEVVTPEPVPVEPVPVEPVPVEPVPVEPVPVEPVPVEPVPVEPVPVEPVPVEPVPVEPEPTADPAQP